MSSIIDNKEHIIEFKYIIGQDIHSNIKAPLKGLRINNLSGAYSF